MRLTVGPLPPAVYWRRRVIVLGVLVSIVALAVTRCGSDSSGDDQADTSSGGSTPSPTSSLLTPIVEATASTQPTTPAPAPQPSGPCTDDEIVVTAATGGSRTQYAAGESVRISLRVKNVSARSCTRDVGGAHQELRISQGAQKLWSSDDCEPAGASDVQLLGAGQELPIAELIWTGRASTSCQNRTVAQPGTYQLIGRVGTATSEPVTLTIGASAK